MCVAISNADQFVYQRAFGAIEPRPTKCFEPELIHRLQAVEYIKFGGFPRPHLQPLAPRTLLAGAESRIEERDQRLADAFECSPDLFVVIEIQRIASVAYSGYFENPVHCDV